MRVAFLTQDLQLSGGVGVVVEHASRLAADHGFDVTLVHTGVRTEREWRFRGLDGLHVLGLAEAVQREYDVAVSTWWETTAWLFDIRARRHASFVQSLEDRFYADWMPERLAAAHSLDLPVAFITEARWIARALDELRPGERAALVRNGIDKEVFAGPGTVTPATDGPLRIVIEGSREIAFKAVDEALTAVSLMGEARHVTLVTPDESGEGAPADRLLARLTHAEMAALYGESHVVLKLSRVEGMFGPPLEGFHAGATCVVTPVTGHEEYVRHRHNGLIVDWDDARGTARALDLLARDRRLLHELRTNALATARTWPSWRQQSAVMAAALRRIAREPPPRAAPLGRRLAHDFDMTLGDGQRRLVELSRVSTQLDDVLGQRAYRWGVALRNAMWRSLRRPVRIARRLRRR